MINMYVESNFVLGDKRWGTPWNPELRPVDTPWNPELRPVDTP